MSMAFLKRVENVDLFLEEMKKKVMEYPEIETLKSMFVHKWNLFTYIVKD